MIEHSNGQYYLTMGGITQNADGAEIVHVQFIIKNIRRLRGLKFDTCNGSLKHI